MKRGEVWRVRLPVVAGHTQGGEWLAKGGKN